MAQDLVKVIKDLYGYPEQLNSRQQDTINRLVQSAKDQVVHPPAIPGENKSYVWSFLRPTGVIATVAGQGDYDLPTNFSSLVGSITYESSSGHNRIRYIVSPHNIREMRARNINSSSDPKYAAILFPSGNNQAKILLYPTPSKVINLTFEYALNTSSLANHLGTEFDDVILHSTLAAAEAARSGKRQKYYYSIFIDKLKGAIQRDREKTSVDFYGYNGNGESSGNTERHSEVVTKFNLRGT